MTDDENSVIPWFGDLRTRIRNIAKCLDGGFRTVVCELEVIRPRWLAEGTP